MKMAHLPHYGVQKSFRILSKKYYWKNMFKDMENYVLSCNTCMVAKPHRIPQAPLQNNPIPTHPGDFLSVDLVGPFHNGMQILTIIDRFSRHLQLVPLKNTCSQNIIAALFKYISTRGRPSMIHADLGQFTAQIFQDFNTKYGIRLTHSSPAHPQPTQSLSALINP